jgi:hypothetical protein
MTSAPEEQKNGMGSPTFANGLVETLADDVPLTTESTPIAPGPVHDPLARAITSTICQTADTVQ